MSDVQQVAMKSLPWFRMYGEFIHDPLIEMLAFEDQRHYVFILCMKSLGELDKEYPKDGMLLRVVGKRLGLFGEALVQAQNRLMEHGLIDDQWQPRGWNKRQFVSDSSANRVAKFRAKKAQSTGNADETLQKRFGNAVDTDTDTDTDTEQIKKKKATAVATPEGVSPLIWSDFLKHRKAKKAPVTETVLEGIRREASKAGWDMGEALQEVCSRGWTGFNADWVTVRSGSTGVLPGAI